MADLGDRRTYLGATDIAAIVGVSPWRAAIDVWREKTGLAGDVEMNERMAWGQRLEDAICDGYTAETGRRLARRAGVAHKWHPFIIGHPDRLVVGEPGVFEAKSAMTRRGYGEAGTDAVPPHVRVQVTVYMGLTGRDWCDVALLTSTSRLDIYRVDYDRELYDALIEAAARFWQENVVAGVEPEPDGSESYRRHLAEKFPHSQDIELIATAEQSLLVDELRAAGEAKAAAEVHEREVENRIRALMAEASVLVAPGGRITYRTEKARVHWQDVAGAIAAEYEPLRASAVVAEFSAKDTEGRDGPRVLRKSWPKAAEEAA